MANLELWRPWRNPFRELAKMETAFDKYFENLPELSKRENGFTFTPACDASEDQNQYTLRFDLPGVPKDQVKIEVANNQLTVSAERREEKKKDTKKMHLEEVNYGSYLRSFTLPSGVDDKRIDAKYENGVLSVSIPKVESTKAKQIAVQ